ncbi:TetR/AcrR family transcriptional regulator [Rhizohabitans arisaemae]|uniref:TetR/AcrR family transcriptional regulator n=1 Tax=Rhizohabitans arisaemae TaxID=2720610 RepID=UPI0024B1B9DB|nr:TetR/AcrR family transcriptional regulator [Rhizohabitans arisaemae]
MESAQPSGTKARIQEVARELFVSQGVRRTSLREIADRLGITKPALYYHFASRDDLVRSIVEPLIEDVEGFLTEREAVASADPRELLQGYFDLLYRHRAVTVMVVRDLSAFAGLDLTDRLWDWRARLTTLLIGPDPLLAAQARAVVAIGGMSDCTVQFAHLPAEEIGPAAVDAACAALGLPAR